jgi:hypothetical protein
MSHYLDGLRKASVTWMGPFDCDTSNVYLRTGNSI